MLRKILLLTVLLAGVFIVIATQLGWSVSKGEAADGPRLISVEGVTDVQGHPTLVHIRALVPAGQDDAAVASALLAAQHARPLTPNELQAQAFSTTGLLWAQFFDANAGNDFVTQFYNPSGQPAGVDGHLDLVSAQGTWTGVSTSSFAFSDGGTTSRCPSLVQECPGPQAFDGFNDVAFASLSGPCNAVFGCTLGVTYSDQSHQEADTALNSKIAWSEGCTDVANRVDVQTVMLHEIGHTLGLGHSDVAGSVMEAFYQGARCSLSQDDIDGITFLYPGAGVTPAPTATPTTAVTPTPTTAVTPAPTPTPDGTTFCPPGQHRKGVC